ncbi:MAG: hypothetical protein EOO41_01060, partial [Methanobacteriota archaeon]
MSVTIRATSLVRAVSEGDDDAMPLTAPAAADAASLQVNISTLKELMHVAKASASSVLSNLDFGGALLSMVHYMATQAEGLGADVDEVEPSEPPLLPDYSDHFARIALAAYSTSEKECLAAAGASFSAADILFAQYASVGVVPAHMLLVDHVAGALVLTIRGTADINGVLTDVALNPVNFGKGQAHQGMMASAESMCRKEYAERVLAAMAASKADAPRAIAAAAVAAAVRREFASAHASGVGVEVAGNDAPSTAAAGASSSWAVRLPWWGAGAGSSGTPPPADAAARVQRPCSAANPSEVTSSSKQELPGGGATPPDAAKAPPDASTSAGQGWLSSRFMKARTSLTPSSSPSTDKKEVEAGDQHRSCTPAPSTSAEPAAAPGVNAGKPPAPAVETSYTVGLVEVLWHAWRQFPGYRIVFCGHSLGAGVSAILCCRIRVLMYSRWKAELAPLLALAAEPCDGDTPLDATPLEAQATCTVPCSSGAVRDAAPPTAPPRRSTRQADTAGATPQAPPRVVGRSPLPQPAAPLRTASVGGLQPLSSAEQIAALEGGRVESCVTTGDSRASPMAARALSAASNEAPGTCVNVASSNLVDGSAKVEHVVVMDAPMDGTEHSAASAAEGEALLLRITTYFDEPTMRFLRRFACCPVPVQAVVYAIPSCVSPEIALLCCKTVRELEELAGNAHPAAHVAGDAQPAIEAALLGVPGLVPTRFEELDTSSVVTTIIVGDDVVPRLTSHSFRSLVQRMARKERVTAAQAYLDRLSLEKRDELYSAVRGVVDRATARVSELLPVDKLSALAASLPPPPSALVAASEAAAAMQEQLK